MNDSSDLLGEMTRSSYAALSAQPILVGLVGSGGSGNGSRSSLQNGDRYGCTCRVKVGGAASAREKAARAWAAPDESEPGADAASAVVAHGLLGNLAVIRGATRMMLAEPRLSPAERVRLLEMLDAQIDLMQGVLADLVRGLPLEALTALDDLRGG